MSETLATRATEAAPKTSRSRALSVTLWVLQILLALMFASAAFPKLTGALTTVDTFARIGIGQWFRYVVGALEVAGAIGLLIPRLAGPAALGLVVLMIGATATQVFIFRADLLFPVIFLLLSALVAWARWEQTRALARMFWKGR